MIKHPDRKIVQTFMPSFNNLPALALFFNIPHACRDNIYQQLLCLRHPIYLFQEPGSRVETFAPERLVKWLALLRVSRQIAREASAIFYATNQFYLVDIMEQQVNLLQAFLDCIVSVNAAKIASYMHQFPHWRKKHAEPAPSSGSLQEFEASGTRCSSQECQIR
jgi:hypothetical protein